MSASAGTAWEDTKLLLANQHKLVLDSLCTRRFQFIRCYQTRLQNCGYTTCQAAEALARWKRAGCCSSLLACMARRQAGGCAPEGL